MKRKLLGISVVAAMLLTASLASAAGVNLAWSNCLGDGGTQNRTFACAVNTPPNHQLVPSFILPAPLANVSGLEIVMDFLTTSDPVPEWWQMKDALTCRQNSLGINAVFTENLCFDWGAAQAVPGIGSYNDNPGPEGWTIDPSVLTRHRRLKAVTAVPPSALQNLLANQEYYSVNITINNAKTVGVGACAGCSENVCIVLNSINVTTPIGANNVFLGSANSAGSNVATWQGAVSDCQLVPTRNKTWGAVKSLYR